jgi:hypothetical protein
MAVRFEGKLLVPATMLLIVASACAQQPPLQSPNALTNSVQDYSLEANSFIDALLKVAARFQFPLGVEWVKSADALKPIRISWTQTTVADIVQEVVSTQARYDWRIEHGVVHVFQRNLVEDPRNPLNITIKALDDHPQTVGFANAVLSQMVSNVALRTEAGGISLSVLGYPGEPTFHSAADNAPARAMLNHLVRCGFGTNPPPAPGMMRIWIATFPEPQELSRTGFLEVVPMLAGSNGAEPFWILEPWGHPPQPNMIR